MGAQGQQQPRRIGKQKQLLCVGKQALCSWVTASLEQREYEKLPGTGWLLEFECGLCCWAADLVIITAVCYLVDACKPTCANALPDAKVHRAYSTGLHSGSSGASAAGVLFNCCV